MSTLSRSRPDVHSGARPLLALWLCSQWDTVPERGRDGGVGWVGRGGGKHRPPSVALCAAIGEAPQGDCATDGHLQATMIPFVQPLPSLKITYPTIDSDLWQGDQVAMILRVCADASH